MPTPNHPKLPLCSELATSPDRFAFAFWFEALLTDPSQEIRQGDAYRLKGMLVAYLELGLIGNKQCQAMTEELTAFAFGAAV